MDNRRTIPGYKYYVDPDTGERPPVRVTFLNVYPAAEGRVNGVAFPVTAEELDELDRRERNYDRIDVTASVDAGLAATVWTYLGSEAARERFADGPAVVAQDYFDAIRAGFAAAGGLDAFERSTDPLTVPLRRLTRVDVPPPRRAARGDRGPGAAVRAGRAVAPGGGPDVAPHRGAGGGGGTSTRVSLRSGTVRGSVERSNASRPPAAAKSPRIASK